MGNILTNYQGKEGEDAHYIVSGNESQSQYLVRNRDLEHIDEESHEYSGRAIEPLQSHTAEFPHFSNTCVTEFLPKQTHSQKHQSFDTKHSNMNLPFYITNKSNKHSNEEMIPSNSDIYVLESIREKIILCSEMEHTSEKWAEPSHETEKYLKFYSPHDSVPCLNHKKENVYSHQKLENWNKMSRKQCQEHGKTNIVQRVTNLVEENDGMKHVELATFQIKKLRYINNIKDYFADDIQSQFINLISFLLLGSAINLDAEQKDGNNIIKRSVVNLISEMYKIQNFKFISGIFLIYLSQIMNKELNQSTSRKLYFINKDSKVINYRPIGNVHDIEEYISNFLEQGLLCQFISILSNFSMVNIKKDNKYTIKLKIADASSKNHNTNTLYQLIACDLIHKFQKSSIESSNIPKPNETCFQNSSGTQSFIFNGRNKCSVDAQKRLKLWQCIASRIEVKFRELINNMYHNHYISSEVLNEVTNFNENCDSFLPVKNNNTSAAFTFEGTVESISEISACTSFLYNGKRQNAFFLKDKVEINGKTVPKEFDLRCILSEGMEVTLHFKNLIKNVQYNSYMPYYVQVLSEDSGAFSDIKDPAVCPNGTTKEELNLKVSEETVPGILNSVSSSWGKAVYNSTGKEVRVLFYKENTYVNETKVPDNIALDSVLYIGMPVKLSFNPDSLNVVTKFLWHIGYVTELNDFTGSILFYDGNVQEKASILSKDVYIDKLKCETSKLNEFLFIGMPILLIVHPLETKNAKYRVAYILRNKGNGYPMLSILNFKPFSRTLDFECEKLQGQGSSQKSHIPHYSETIFSIRTALVSGGLMWRECLQNKCFANIGNCMGSARFADSPGIILDKEILRVWVWGKHVDVLFNTNDVYINGERCPNPEVGAEFHCTASILPSPGQRGETHFAWCVWQGLRPEVQHVFNSFSGLCPEELVLEEQTFYKGLVVAIYPPNAAIATISVGRTSVPVVIYVNILTEKKTKQGFPSGPWIIDYINVGDYLNVTVRRAQKSNKSLNKLGFKWIAISASKIDLRGITHKAVLKNLYEGSPEESQTITGTVFAVYFSFGLIMYTYEDKVDIGIFIKNQLLIDGRKLGPTEQLKNILKNCCCVSFTVKWTNFINKEIHLISFSIKSVKNYDICAISNFKCLCQLKNYQTSKDSTSLNKYCGKITDIMDDAAILSCGEKRILFHKNNLFISGFKREDIRILSEVIQKGMIFYCITTSLDDNFVHYMDATDYSFHVWDGVLPILEYMFDGYFNAQATDVPPINTELSGVVTEIVSPHVGMVIVEYNSYKIPVLIHINNFSLEKGGEKLTKDHWIQEYISLGDTVFLLIKNCKRFRFLTAKEFWKSVITSNSVDWESYEEYDQTHKNLFKEGLVVNKFQEVYDSNNLQLKDWSLLNHDNWKLRNYSENESTLPSRFRSIEGIVSEKNVATVCIDNLAFNVYYTDNVIFINGKRGSEINVGDCILCTAIKQFVPEMKKEAYVAWSVWQGMRPDVDKVFESFYNDSLSVIVLAENEEFAGTVSAIYPPDAAIVSVSLGCLHIPIILYVEALKYKKSLEIWINDFISIGDRIYLYVKRSSRALNRLGFKWVATSAYKIEDRMMEKVAAEKKFPSQSFSGIITALYEQFGLISFQIKNEQKVAMFFKENININGENILPSVELKDIYETGFPVCFNVDSDPNQKKQLYMANNVMTKYLSLCKKCGLQCSCSINDVNIDLMLKNSEFCGKIEKLDTKVGYVTFKFNGRNELAFFFKSKTIYNGVRVKHQSEPSVLRIGSSVVMKLRRVDDESKYNAKFIADYVEVKDLPSICNSDNLCSYPVKEHILKSITAKVKYYKTNKCGVLGFSYYKKYYEVQFTDDVIVYPQDSQNISLPELWPIGKQLYIDAKLNQNLSDVVITSVWDNKKGKETYSVNDSFLQADTLYKAVIKDIKNPKGYIATINYYGSNVSVLVPHSILNCCDKLYKGLTIHVIVEKLLEPENNILWKAVKAWEIKESDSTSNSSEHTLYVRKGTLMKLKKDYGLLQTEDGLIVFESHWTYLYGICLDDIHLTDLFQPGDILNYSLGINKGKRNVKVWFGSDIGEDFSTIYNDLITYCSLKQVPSAIINVLMMRLGVMRKLYPNIDTDLRSERLANGNTKKYINKDDKQSVNLKRYALFLTSSSSSESFDEIQSCENILKPINSTVNNSNNLPPFRSQSEKRVKIKNDIQSGISIPTFSEKPPDIIKIDKQVEQNQYINYKEKNSLKEKFQYLKQEKVENKQMDILHKNKVANSNKNAQYSNLKPYIKDNFQFLSEEIKDLIKGSLISTLNDEGFDHDCLHNTTYELLNNLESEVREHIIKAVMTAIPTSFGSNLQAETSNNIYEKWKHKFKYEIEMYLTRNANESVCQFNSEQHSGYLGKNIRAEVKMADKATQTISTGKVLYLKLYPNI